MKQIAGNDDDDDMEEVNQSTDENAAEMEEMNL